MATPAVRACLRCHAKKIRCTGYPACRACAHAAVQCEQYRRPKKSDTIEALHQARQRIQWLEEEVRITFNIDCRELSTGSSLKSFFGTLPAMENQESNTSRHQGVWTEGPRDAVADVQLERDPDEPSSPANNASEMSVLALNATGEMKYLGPSSGAFFATYASAVARSLVSDQGEFDKRPYIMRHGDAKSSTSKHTLSENRDSLSKEETQALLQSYKMWVHPLYPLFNPNFLDRLVVQCCDFEALNHMNKTGASEMNSQLTIFYLVMALGATNHANTMRQSRANQDPELRNTNIQEVSYSGFSPALLYSKAMKYFDGIVQNFRTSVTAIEIILLISIYSSYGTIGSSQWQLAGLAMRMAIEIGLHHAPKIWQPSDIESDRKDRVFWIAYAIEISLAYNLGRPPSIGDEHITARLPRYAEETALGIHHINHRRIQSRIVSRVYCGANRAGDVTDDEASCLIFKLQDDLNKWRNALPAFAQSSPYPQSYWERLYHGSSFVLHRSSPLCPRPSPSSAGQCIRSAGAYIDCILEVLRNSNVPLTWMLVQGVLFAGLTMLVTARTSFLLLARHSGLSFLFVDLPGWTRKCSICLAIMNERWSEDLLQKLDTQFESLANDTLRTISSTLTTQHTERTLPVDNTTSPDQPSSIELSHQFTQPRINEAVYPNAGTAGDLEYLETFREYLGIDGVETFWDVFPSGLSGMDVDFPPLDTNDIQNAGFAGRSEDIFQTW